jgi:undecaprenyl-diphosphatase
VDWLHRMDIETVRLLAEHRRAPLTDLMRVASAWWFKSIVLIGIGLVADLRRPPRLPVAAVSATVAYAAASGLSAAFKDLTDRARPPLQDPDIIGIGLPGSSAMPSAHAATAFAAAVAIGMVHPRLRPWVLALAALVSVSRVYLGVHFPTDVLVGALLGVACGWAVGTLTRRAVRRLPPDAGRAAGTPTAGSPAHVAGPEGRGGTRSPG